METAPPYVAPICVTPTSGTGGQGLMIAQNTASLSQVSNSTFSWCPLLSQTESMTTEYRRDIRSIHY
jgi:hypothetical protein